MNEKGVNHVIAAKGITVAFKVGSILSKSVMFAVDHVDLSIPEGRTLALVGESGSGKTTLGKTLVGIYKPVEGSVYFRGKDVSKMNKEEYMKYRLKCQYVHQDPYSSLNPYKTVYHILAVPLKAKRLVRDTTEEREVVNKALEEVGLNPQVYSSKYPFELSGGERQRVSIARTLIVKPEFIVADEPVTMLDASLRLDILDLLLDIQKRVGLGMLFITHDLGIAYYVGGDSGEIAVMYLGSIVEYGPADKILNKPLHPYTQALLSAIPEPDPERTRSKRPIQLRNSEPPNPLKVPKGCKFSDRCPFVINQCHESRPQLKRVGDVQVACWLY